MESLESLLKSLYLISGLNMSLFDINGNLLASYPHQKCPFCHALSKNPEALSHCTASDLQAIEHVKREEKIYIYQCHFHLYEGIMPLYSYGSLTGYLMLGQTITKSPIHHAQVIETASPFFENNYMILFLKFLYIPKNRSLLLPKFLIPVPNICPLPIRFKEKMRI